MSCSILPRSMALVERLLVRSAGTPSAGLSPDPLALGLTVLLPPLPGIGSAGGEARIGRGALETLAALYFQAELESAGLLPVAEVLAEARFQLQVTDPAAAALLEEFAVLMRGRYHARPQRQQLYARTFGLGPGANDPQVVAVNRGFENAFAGLCAALERYQAASRWGQAPSGAVVRVEYATGELLDNLERQRYGNTLFAARAIQQQLAKAIEMLNHPGLVRLFRGQSLWDVIRNILGTDAPDLSRHVARAQAGLRLMEWLADNLPNLSGAALSRVLASSSQPFLAASSWLHATGVAQGDSHGQPPGYAERGYGTRSRDAAGIPVPGYGQRAPGQGSAGSWS